MAAEGEEVVVHADAVEAEDLGERGADELLAGVRGAAAGAGGVLGGGQRLAVELAVRGQRQVVQDDHGRRDHVLGQPPGREAAHVLGQAGLAGGGHHVGDQAGLAGRVLAGDHRRPRHRRVGGDGGLHLARLDPEAAHLDLLVGAPGEHQLPVPGPPHQVTGAVEPLAGRERRGHEPLRGQRRAAHVAAGDLRASDVELARHAGSHRLQVVVQHEHAGVGQRPAERQHAVPVGVHPAGRGDHGGLGRPVRVDEPALPRPGPRQAGRHVLGAYDHRLDAGQVARLQDREQRGHDAGRAHPGRLDERAQQGRLRTFRRAGHDQRAAAGQGHRHVQHRRVERERRELQHRHARADVHQRPEHRDEVREGRVLDRHALGPPGRA